MSKAFTKEDIELPERPRKVRPASGLPPGALNYMTADGAQRLREELASLREAAPPEADADVARQERIVELTRALATATVVPMPDQPREEVLFGTTVTLRRTSGEVTRYRIVGVDETQLDPGWVSWISPIARALIGARVGEQVDLPHLPMAATVEVLEIAG